MQKSTISVLMATYNEPLDYLKLAIESVLNQTYKDFEFIIILDNPNNQEIENFIKQYQKKDDRIIFLKNKKNLWRWATRNRWINIAKWKYIAIIDADDFMEKNRLEEQKKYIEKNNKDIIFSWANLIDENNNIVWKFNPSRQKVEQFSKNFFKENLFIHPAMLCKAEILKNLKYDKYFLNAQDYDFLIRCIIKWYKFSIVEKYLFNYRTPTWLTYDKRYEKLKNYSYYTFKALWKHKKHFWKRRDFWFKFFYSFFAWCSLRFLPKKFNIFLFKMLDKKRNK